MTRICSGLVDERKKLGLLFGTDGSLRPSQAVFDSTEYGLQKGGVYSSVARRSVPRQKVCDVEFMRKEGHEICGVRVAFLPLIRRLGFAMNAGPLRDFHLSQRETVPFLD